MLNGHNDVIAPTINSYTSQQNLPNAQLILYPDANHGSFIQYHELFVEHANAFLTWTIQDAATTSGAERSPFPMLPAECGDDEFGPG